MKTILSPVACCILFFTLVFSQVSWAQYDSAFNAFAEQAEDEFESFEERNQKLFNDFVKKNDEAFTNLLRKAWSDQQVLLGIDPPDEPKPKDVPTIEPMEIDEDEPEEIPVEIPEEDPQAEKKKKEKDNPAIPPIQKEEPDDFDKNTIRFSFYGQDIELKADKALSPHLGSLDNEAIANAFEELAETNHYHLINQIRAEQHNMNLNDWGYYLLTKKAAGEIASNTRDARLLTWFLMVKSRYKMKVAYNSNKLFLLLPSRNMMYGRPYFTIDGGKYFVLDEKYSGNVKTYEGQYPDAQMQVNFDIRKSPGLHATTDATKNLSFSYKGQDYSFPVKYNKNVIDFYQDYPLVEVKVYFDAVLSPTAKDALLQEFGQMLQGKSELEAVSLLLKFAQTAFAYKTDDDQFGREKFFFPEELFHFPYSDCEDRSVIFAYLVRELLNLEVVGLGYPGHMATAVNFSNDIGRDYMMYKGKKFTVCDPTYMGAPVGMCMPQFSDVKADFIELDNHQFEAYTRKKLWATVNKAGGYRGGINDDVVFDEKGNAYVTGFFADEATFGSQKLEAANGSHDGFVAKYDKDLNLVWVRQFGGEGNDAGNTIGLDDKGNCYVKGSFEDEMSLREFNLTADHQSDVFLARFTNGGKLSWASKLPIEASASDQDKVFVGRFDYNGEHITTFPFDQKETFSNYGISFREDEIVITASVSSGSMLASAGKDMMFNTGFRYNRSPLEVWQEESERLRKADYEETIVGLFVFMNTMKANGTMVEGELIQKALLRYNSSFSKNSPQIFQNIGKISLMKNAGGIITVKTEKGGAVDFRLFRIEDDAKLKITTFKGGNAQVNFLTGASIANQAYISYDLNYVKLIKNTGNLVLDYDDDHSQKVVNLRKDLLN